MGEGDAVPQGFLVVDDHILDILFEMDSEVLITSPLGCCRVLCLLGVAFERFRDLIPFDEPPHSNVISMERFDCQGSSENNSNVMSLYC